MANEKKQDVINPDHYKWHPSGVECISIAEHFSYSLGAVIKYVWRAGLKSSSTKLEDLRKAKRYLEFEIAKEERERDK